MPCFPWKDSYYKQCNRVKMHPAPVGTAACPVSLRSLPSSLCCTAMSPSLGATATKVTSEDGALMVRWQMKLPLLSPEYKALYWVGFVVSSEFGGLPLRISPGQSKRVRPLLIQMLVSWGWGVSYQLDFRWQGGAGPGCGCLCPRWCYTA